MSDFENMGNSFEEENVENVEEVETVENSFEDLGEAPVAPEAPQPDFTEYDENEEDIPVYEDTAEEKGKKPFAITSLICGIASIVCCCIPILCYLFPIAGIVFGILSLKKEEGRGKGMAIAGIVCGSIGAIYIIFAFVVGQAFMPMYQEILSDPSNAEEIIQNYMENL